MTKSDKEFYRYLLLWLLMVLIAIFAGCMPVPCLQSEAKHHQRHWYDEKRCEKRSKAKMWWMEHGQQGMILSKNEERRLYK